MPRWPKRAPPLTAEQSALAAANIWFAYKKAKDLSCHDFDEIVGVCMLALCHAARGFDPAKGAFTTIAARSMERDVWKFRARKYRLRNAVVTFDEVFNGGSEERVRRRCEALGTLIARGWVVRSKHAGDDPDDAIVTYTRTI